MKRILIIDDDDELRHVIRKMLEREGYAVLDAREGSEGIRIQGELPADLIITDIFMPGMEGLQTIRELKAGFPAVGILAISGGSNRIADFCPLMIAEKLGAFGSLQKPFSRKELLDKVQVILSRETPPIA